MTEKSAEVKKSSEKDVIEGILTPSIEANQLMEKMRTFRGLLSRILNEAQRFLNYDPRKGTVLREKIEDMREKSNLALQEKYKVEEGIKETKEAFQKKTMMQMLVSRKISEISEHEKAKRQDFPIFFSFCRNQPELVLVSGAVFGILPKIFLRKIYPSVFKAGFMGAAVAGSFVLFANVPQVLSHIMNYLCCVASQMFIHFSFHHLTIS